MSLRPDPAENRSPEPEAWELPADLQHLASGGQAGLVAEILEDFRRDAGARIARMDKAVAAGNPAAVALETHSVKGSAAQMGAAELAAACAALETDAHAGRLADAEPRLAEIHRLFEAVCQTIARHPLRRADLPADGAAERT